MFNIKLLTSVSLSAFLVLTGASLAAAHESHSSLLDIYIKETNIEVQIKTDPKVISENLEVNITSESSTEDFNKVSQYIVDKINLETATGEKLIPDSFTSELNYIDEPYIFLTTVKYNNVNMGADFLKIKADFFVEKDPTHIIYVFVVKDEKYVYDNSVDFYSIAELFQGYSEIVLKRGNPPEIMEAEPVVIENTQEELPTVEDNSSETVTTITSERQVQEKNFGESVIMGFRHILNGTDHLLFLAMLLIPAPLVIKTFGKKLSWGERRPAIGTIKRIVWIVTAFTVGHSITLAIVTLTDFPYPVLATELIVAGSVGLAAVHALKPLVSKGEIFIASIFGLVHGTAFAGKLQELNMEGWNLIFALLGFNIGVELAQLAVLAVFLPILWFLSKWNKYNVLRTIFAIMGILASIYWGIMLIIGA